MPTVQTAEESIVVVLAPRQYLEGHGLKIDLEQRLEITGSRVARPGAPVLVAAEIKAGNRTVRLRDPDGRPLWQAEQGKPQGP